MSKAHSQRVSSEQRGIALISVLLVVAVLVAITTRLLEDHNLVVHHHRATFEQNQALQYAYGAETLARQVLFQDYANTDPKIDHLAEPWAKQLAPFELDDIGYMETQLRDLNGCFNLNAFASNDEVILKRALKRLKRMLRELQIDESLADNVRDWIDADSKVQGFGAEDNNYLGKMPAYRAANRGMAHVSELYLLDIADPDQVKKLLPFVCLLPYADNKINVNTANTLTLATMDDGIGVGNAEAITMNERAYNSVSDFVKDHPEFSAVADDLSVTSEHFALHVQAVVGEGAVSMYSHLVRSEADGRVTVLQRDFAKLFRSSLQIDASTEAE